MQHARAHTTHTQPTHTQTCARASTHPRIHARRATHARSHSYVRCNRVHTVPTQLTQVQVHSRTQARVDASTRAYAQTLRESMRNRSQPIPGRISSVGFMYDPCPLILLRANRRSSCTRSSSRRGRRRSSGRSFSSLGRCAIEAATRRMGRGKEGRREKGEREGGIKV